MSDERVDLPDYCPKCGCKTLFGFGLAGGGYGSYVICSDTKELDCDFFAKREEVYDGH